jgi:hypothetical protein
MATKKEKEDDTLILCFLKRKAMTRMDGQLQQSIGTIQKS